MQDSKKNLSDCLTFAPMPLIASSFKPSFLFRNRHIQTLARALFRKAEPGIYTRERIDTPDGDFLDIDWITKDNKELVIICHGLEGSSHGSYVTGMAKYLSENGFDILAMNFRSCSGEMNRTLRFYHSGETGDLNFVINHTLKKGKYSSIYLLGFSIGGNVVLKYTGELGDRINPVIKKVIAISPPVHLETAAFKMNHWSSKIYLKNFLVSLKSKMVLKSKIMPDFIGVSGIKSIRTFHEFDDHFTAPLHGFKNAHEYYTAASSVYFLNKISIPVLIISADDDPFLSAECFPKEEAEKNPNLFLEISAHGGHVGFIEKKLNGIYWTERRAVEFFNGHL